MGAARPDRVGARRLRGADRRRARTLGLVDAGYRAIESLRLEKGYRAWGADIGPDTTPHEAGLGWAVKLAAGRAFRGRAAVEAQARDGVRKLLAGFTPGATRR